MDFDRRICYRYRPEGEAIWGISVQMRIRTLFVGTVTAASLLAAPLLASAGELAKPDGFPNRPITIIVPYGAGGGSDQLTRAMAASLEKVTDVGVQVVNKPGGGGLAAVPDFMTAPADGYTIMEAIDDAVPNTCRAS
jgi:tripartite-type tricarboxylate transporter receptor subunit TctC